MRRQQVVKNVCKMLILSHELRMQSKHLRAACLFAHQTQKLFSFQHCRLFLVPFVVMFMSKNSIKKQQSKHYSAVLLLGDAYALNLLQEDEKSLTRK